MGLLSATMSWQRSIYSVLVLMIAPSLCVGCEQASHIHFVVPDGYQGFLRIKEGIQGLKVSNHNGMYIYNFPSSGELLVADDRPLQLIETQTAETQSGQKMLWQGMLESVGPPFDPRVRIYPLEADSDGWYYYFVGNEQDYASIKNSTSRPPFR